MSNKMNLNLMRISKWVGFFYETNLYIQQESLDLNEKLINTCIKIYIHVREGEDISNYLFLFLINKSKVL